MVREIDIRKNLAQNLGILETGLDLIEEEFYLPNPLGSRGYIDILARDIYGNRVIIELKRSDAIAREAIHELCKYVSLFKSKSGFTDDRIRLFIVSTHWHELRVPFATFAQTSLWQVDGFKLEINSDGEVLKATKVEKLQNPVMEQQVSLYPLHSVYLFRDRSKRNKGNKKLKKLLKSMGLTEYCIVELAYNGGSPNVIPYGLYMVMAKIDEFNRNMLSENLIALIAQNIQDSESLEDHIQNIANGRAYDFADDIDASTPESFTSMLRNWVIENIYRFGRLSRIERLTEAELIEQIQGLDGDNVFVYHKVSNPRYAQMWSEDIEDIGHFLATIPVWQTAWQWLISDLDTMDAMVSVSIYKGQNLFIDFVNFSKSLNIHQFAYFEAVVTQPNKHTRVLIGYLRWDRKTCPKDPETIFVDTFRDSFDFMLLKDDAKLQSQVLSQHGLSYSVMELVFSPEDFEKKAIYTIQIDSTQHVTRIESEIDFTDINVLAFIEHNPQYFSKLIAYMHTVIRWVT